MGELREVLERAVGAGEAPGAVALVARGERAEVVCAGRASLETGVPMARDTIFRLASITKPIVVAAVLMLVEDGLLGPDEPVRRWLPELAEPVVVRTPGSPVDDVVPARRPVTVEDLLSSRAGWGFPSDFDLPAVGALFEVQIDGREVQQFPPAGEWLAALGRVPMLYQPGEAFLYGSCSDLQGALVARVTGRSLPEFLAERVFEPLGMVDTAFEVPAAKRDRFTGYYRRDDAGALVLHDPPDGQWSRLPAFPSGGGGLAGTADDWWAFARMLLAGGVTPAGRRLLSEESVRLMTTNHLTPAQRAVGQVFLEGQGWGYGGTVDVEVTEPWHVPGRYGWVGGTGTTAHLVPSTGLVTILLTQVAVDSPVPARLLTDFWRATAGG